MTRHACVEGVLIEILLEYKSLIYEAPIFMTRHACVEGVLIELLLEYKASYMKRLDS
jgi:hypothetical protein